MNFVIELKNIGVTPQKASQFNKKKIFYVENLARFFPNKYYDFSKEILPSKHNFSKETETFDRQKLCCFTAKVIDVDVYDAKTFTICATLTNKQVGRIKVFWFCKKFIHEYIKSCVGYEVFVAGEYTHEEKYNSYTISMPIVFTKDIETARKFYSIYKKIPGMSDEYLKNKISVAVSNEAITQERIPREILKQNSLCSYKEALTKLHFPNSLKDIEEANYRIEFESLLYFCAKLEQINSAPSSSLLCNLKSLKILNDIYKNLPFELTNDQKETIRSIIAQIRSGKRIDALIQGDVGCGKTIVAILLMAAMVSNGYQVALMAPTQVLAKQHYDDITKLLENSGVSVAFVSSGMKKKEKTEIFSDIKTGKIGVVVGTHAILSDELVFKNLALTITDEEHRFGTVQRETLTQKASQGIHSITMSATPIPRSLAQVLYGNSKQLYTIATMPNGRLPVKTTVSNSFKETFRFLKEELNKNKQVYVVCPMIEQNENCENVKSVEEIEEIYKKEFQKDGYIVSSVTGKDKKEEIEAKINAFKNGETNILVSTTVIEVGVNVPNASVIVIHNAERFGLASLHQLRGRVGRSSYQSHCILFSDKSNNERLRVLTETNNGFDVAQQDLVQRGAGNILGTEQSGFTYYMELMFKKPEIYKKAKDAAQKYQKTGTLNSFINFFDTINETEK